jgi:hypothetical protein
MTTETVLLNISAMLFNIFVCIRSRAIGSFFGVAVSSFAAGMSVVVILHLIVL